MSVRIVNSYGSWVVGKMYTGFILTAS